MFRQFWSEQRFDDLFEDRMQHIFGCLDGRFPFLPYCADLGILVCTLLAGPLLVESEAPELDAVVEFLPLPPIHEVIKSLAFGPLLIRHKEKGGTMAQRSSPIDGKAHIHQLPAFSTTHNPLVEGS